MKIFPKSTLMKFVIVNFLLTMTSCYDDFPSKFEVFRFEQLNENSDFKVDQLFPGPWEKICLEGPGTKTIHVIERALPELNLEWMKDSLLQQSNYPSRYGKVLFSIKMSSKFIYSTTDSQNSKLAYAQIIRRHASRLEVFPNRKTHRPFLLNYNRSPTM